MTLYSGQTTQLIQGVSQQHPKDRAEGQIGEQVNCISDIVQGLRRRPAAKVLAALTDINTSFTLDDTTAIYAYDRGDGSEKYIVFVDKDGYVKVFDAITGIEKAVTGDPQTYLACADPRADLRFHTIADVTYILNTGVEIASSGSVNSVKATQDIICSTVSYGHTYTIKSPLGTTIAEVTTPSTVAITSTSIDKTLTLSVDDLIKALVTGSNPGGWTIVKYLDDGTSWFGKSDWTWTYGSTWIKLTHGSLLFPYYSTSWAFEVSDGNANRDLKLYSARVGSTDDLPATAPPSKRLIVSVSEDAGGQDAVMIFTNDTWVETVLNDGNGQLDASTMPHKLTRTAAGTFTLGTEYWFDRKTGTGDSNPLPSFVGKTATGIGTYQNRLYISSEENVCMTRAFARTTWFAESVLAPSDDDPIDSSSSDNQVTDILHAVNYQGSLVLFSHTAQFIHPADVALTPATYGVSAVTRYNVSPAVPPIVTGSAIVFPTEFGDSTHMWEFDTNTISGNPQCEENTKHVSSYIKGKPVQVIGNTNSDFVFVRTDDDDKAIYVVQSYIKDGKRAQLAWHKWEFENCDKIMNISLLQQTLYLVCLRGTDVTLETIDLSLPDTENSEFELFLDHYYSNQVSAGTWTVDGNDYTARVALAEEDIETFVEGYNGSNEGFIINDYAIDSGYVYMNRPATMYVIQGYPFSSYGTLTSPFVRDQNGRPYTKRTIIDDININLQQTSYCGFCIKHKAGVDHIQNFTGIVLNNWQYEIGVASLLDTDFYIPVRDYRELIEICFTSDHHLGFSLMSMEWTARMQTRGRRSQ